MICDVVSSQVLQQFCHNAGVVLEFLLLYSPDFNPIEEALVEMKA